MNPYANLMADMIARDELKRKMLLAEAKQTPIKHIETANFVVGVCLN